jgi:hypothetical protein
MSKTILSQLGLQILTQEAHHIGLMNIDASGRGAGMFE